MRRFSNAVGRDPVMLYRHVPNNAAVLDGVAEIVLAQLLVDTPTRTGPANCAPSPTTSADWPWRGTCWSLDRWPPRSGSGHRECCGH